MTKATLCSLFIVISCSLLSADSYNLVTFDIGGASTTYLYGINNNGWIVGAHNNNPQGFIGFAYHLDTQASIGFDFGSQHDYAAGINDINDVVGHYGNWWDGYKHGFYYDSAQSAGTTIDYPGATYTYLYGINSSRQIVGAYQINQFRGLIYDVAQQTWDTFAVSGHDHTYAYDINDAGLVVGSAGGAYQSVSFVMNSHDKIIQTFTHPDHGGANYYTEAYGVNNNGDIVGRFNASGFVKTGQQWVPVHYPGAWNTRVLDINDDGVIVGWYENPGNQIHGFIGYPIPAVCGDAFHPIPEGDINQDCHVNLNDIAIFAAAWMRQDCSEPDNCDGADFESPAGQVGMPELIQIADNWLICIMEEC